MTIIFSGLTLPGVINASLNYKLKRAKELMEKWLTLLSPRLPSFSFLQVKSTLDFFRCRLNLTCSCSFTSLLLQTAEMLSISDLRVPCQPDRQGWILPNEASQDLDTCSSSLSDPYSLPGGLQTLSTPPTHTHIQVTVARQNEERWNLRRLGCLSR